MRISNYALTDKITEKMSKVMILVNRLNTKELVYKNY